MNWRSRPLQDIATIINLIAVTTAEAGLTVYCAQYESCYKTGIKVTQVEMDAPDIDWDAFRGEWNYKLLARADTNAVISWRTLSSDALVAPKLSNSMPQRRQCAG